MDSQGPGRWFGHSGDLGDIIYALPTIRAAGGGTLYVYHSTIWGRHGMDANKAESLRSLLVLQPYINEVIFCANGLPDGSREHKLNLFRLNRKVRNLADMHLASYGFAPSQREKRWITVDRANPASRVVFARSARYHNRRFPWKRVWKKFERVAGFVGTIDEYSDFCDLVGPVLHLPTRNLLEVAQVIAGSQLFVGNQSCPAAIAEGLKHPMILEVCPRCANCSFRRRHRLEAWGANFILPDLEGL